MTAATDALARLAHDVERLCANVGQAVLGKRHVIELAVTCLLSEGHLLLEDYPGTGKTLLARALANSIVGSHARIQFTPDLLPSDVTGVQIYDQASRGFQFLPGPIFHSIVLADEINRASPKTQSALLEVMDEGHVTVDGVEHPVGRPFMVIATQNPIDMMPITGCCTDATKVFVRCSRAKSGGWRAGGRERHREAVVPVLPSSDRCTTGSIRRPAEVVRSSLPSSRARAAMRRGLVLIARSTACSTVRLPVLGESGKREGEARPGGEREQAAAGQCRGGHWPTVTVTSAERPARSAGRRAG